MNPYASASGHLQSRLINSRFFKCQISTLPQIKRKTSKAYIQMTIYIFRIKSHYWNSPREMSEITSKNVEALREETKNP